MEPVAEQGSTSSKPVRYVVRPAWVVVRSIAVAVAFIVSQVARIVEQSRDISRPGGPGNWRDR